MRSQRQGLQSSSLPDIEMRFLCGIGDSVQPISPWAWLEYVALSLDARNGRYRGRSWSHCEQRLEIVECSMLVEQMSIVVFVISASCEMLGKWPKWKVH